jgi:hypothetical protein
MKALVVLKKLFSQSLLLNNIHKITDSFQFFWSAKR